MRSNVAPARSIAAVAPREQLVGDVVVEARLDDEQMRWAVGHRLQISSEANHLDRLRKPRNVARDLIDLEVDAVARLALAPGGHGKRVRNDRDVEAAAASRR